MRDKIFVILMLITLICCLYSSILRYNFYHREKAKSEIVNKELDYYSEKTKPAFYWTVEQDTPLIDDTTVSTIKIPTIKAGDVLILNDYGVFQKMNDINYGSNLSFHNNGVFKGSEIFYDTLNKKITLVNGKCKETSKDHWECELNK